MQLFWAVVACLLKNFEYGIEHTLIMLMDFTYKSSRTQNLPHNNDSHHTLTPNLQQIINTSELTVQC